MDDPFESPEEREEYLLRALQAVALNEPATFMQISVGIGESGTDLDPVDDEKLRDAVKRLEYRGLVFIDREDLVHVADPG